MKVGVILLAAGSGSRFGGEIPKQYVEVAGRPLIVHTLRSLARESRIEVVLPVLAEGDARFAAALAGESFPFEILKPVAGGPARAVSMQHGINALPEEIDLVAVHDAARPLPGRAMLAEVLDTAMRYGAAVPGIEVADTIKRVDAQGRILDTPDRRFLRAVQTPQVARRDWFVEALELEAERLEEHTDDASLLEAAGFPVYVSSGDPRNRKMTTRLDLDWLQAELGTESRDE